MQEIGDYGSRDYARNPSPCEVQEIQQPIMSTEGGLEKDGDPGLTESTNPHSYEALFTEDNCAYMMLFRHEDHDSCQVHSTQDYGSFYPCPYAVNFREEDQV